MLYAGMKINRLTLVREVRVDGRRGFYWVCICDCGNKTTKYAGHLKRGDSVACGCVKGAKKTHGLSRTPEYKAWDNARSRCRNPQNRKYPLYGGRGITMCAAWAISFDAFISDLGRKPSPAHSLDRIDSNGNYEPGNCRWATAAEQNNNRSFNRFLCVHGEVVTVAQAAVITGIPHATILGRLDAGKSDAEAISHG